jgi:hypothetical protein
LLVASVAFAITGGQWLILGIGRIAVRRGPVTSLAGRRLLAEVRSPGRVAAVLFASGATLAVLGRIGVEELQQVTAGEALAGSTFAALIAVTLATVVAAVVATASLAVGAGEQILDSRRATAVLVALAASPRFVQQVIRRQLLLACVPAAVLGALTGWLVISDFGSGRLPNSETVAALPISALAAGLVAGAGALVAARALRPAIHESSMPDNLRTA